MIAESTLKRVKWSRISSMNEGEIKKPRTWEKLSGSNSEYIFM